MDNVSLKVEQRNIIGSGKLNRVRNNGYIPGVLYGMGMDATPIQVKESLLKDNLRHYGVNTIFQVDLGGSSQTAVIKELQMDKLKKGYLHVDLQRISPDQKREAKVPIRIVGKDSTKHHNAVFIHQLEQITVEGLPSEIPEYIEVNVSDMKTGDTFTVEQLLLPENLTVINQPGDVIVSLSHTHAPAQDQNPADNTAANQIPIIENDEREIKAT